MDNLYYILDEHNNPVVTDLVTWARWQAEDRNRWIVKQDYPMEGIRVSTVFLGINHAYLYERPVLFETMIFGGEHDQYQERYHTWQEAEEGHKRAIAMVFEVTSNPEQS